jgi:hypothetical protein
MADHVIDTNVLLVASSQDEGSPFSDSDVPVPYREEVLSWLATFHSDPARLLVLDSSFRIYDEYRHKLTDQDFGLQVVHQKLQHARFNEVDFDLDGYAAVPEAFARFDPSDRKFVAAILAEAPACSSTIVNASDTDWLEIEHALDGYGIVVEHLLETWLRDKHRTKKGL